jgi:hypothetical protein
MPSVRYQLPLAVIFATTGLLYDCTPWHLESSVAPVSSTFDSTKVYRLTLKDGLKQVVDHPRISGDSLFWTDPINPDAPKKTPIPRSVPVSQIQQVEVQESNVVGTIFAVWLGAGALVYILTGGQGL